nr:hypothetical protein [Tanacetum cinerariifolium]
LLINMDVSSNEKDIAVLDRRPRQKNDFNKFQHKMKNEGKSGLANVVKERYEALKEKQVRQKKQQEDHEHRALWKVDEELEVTKERFSELMGIVEKEPTFDNQHRIALAQSMLRYVNDAKDLKNQPWLSLAMTSLQNGRYETGKTKNIGGCVFFLQLCLMRKYDEELDLFKLNDDQIKKFQIKWEEDYGHMCAREGYSMPLVNKIVRTIGEVCKILQDNEKPINMRCLMHTDESLEKFMSEAAALCRSQRSASKSVAIETEDNALHESLQEQQGTQDASESVSIETRDNALVAAHKQGKKRLTKNAKAAHKPGDVADARCT